MALETGTYINSLNPANPAGTDPRAQGDDHIRLLKSTIKNTFPNINSAVTVTDEQLNSIAGSGVLCFPGMIVMWSGTVATIPAGWKLCNGVGTISTGAAVPNLVGKFIVGSATDSGSTYDIGDTGGAANFTYSGVTGDSNPAFTIPITGYNITGSFPSPGSPTVLGGLIGGRGVPEVVENLESLSTLTGAGPTVNINHSHTVSISVANGRLPPYYALAYLIKN